MSASEVIEWGVALAATVGDLAPLPAEDAVELVQEIARLRDRVAELESGEVRTEWGVRRTQGQSGVVSGAPLSTEAVVREFVRMWPDYNYGVSWREVRTITGPWTDADTHTDGDNS